MLGQKTDVLTPISRRTHQTVQQKKRPTGACPMEVQPRTVYCDVALVQIQSVFKLLRHRCIFTQNIYVTGLLNRQCYIYAASVPDFGRNTSSLSLWFSVGERFLSLICKTSYDFS
jgi:hypothetical protein